MATSQAPGNTGFDELKPTDLQDPTLWKLNYTLKFVFDRIAGFYTPGNMANYPSQPTFDKLFVDDQAQPPDNPNELLTRASGDALYSPKTQRTALLTGAYPQTIVEPNPVQPISPGTGGGSGGGGNTVTWYIGTISGGFYTPNITNGQFQQILLTSNITVNAVVGATTPAQLGFVFVQDATGGRTVAWNASYIGVGAGDVDPTANSYSIFEFVLRGSDLRPVLVRRPLVGMPWP